MGRVTVTGNDLIGWLRGSLDMVQGDVDPASPAVDNKARLYKSTTGPRLKFKHVDVTSGEERTFVLDYHSGIIRIEDPADSSAYLEIDPANSRVTAEGGARPTRSRCSAAPVAVPFGVTQVWMNSHVRGISFATSQDKAVTFRPFWIPETMDNAVDFDVFAMIQPSALEAAGTQFRTNTSVGVLIGDGGIDVVAPVTVQIDHTVAGPWSAAIELNLGTFSIVNPGDVVGIEVEFERTWFGDSVSARLEMAQTLKGEFLVSEV